MNILNCSGSILDVGFPYVMQPLKFYWKSGQKISHATTHIYACMLLCWHINALCFQLSPKRIIAIL